MEASLLQYILDAVGPLGVTIATILGMLVVVGQAVVVITPTKKDDNFVAELYQIPFLGGILKALAAFAPLQKKDGK